MRHIIALMILTVSLFACTGVKNTVKTLPDEAYLEVVSANKTYKQVEVHVDNTKFIATVGEKNTDRPKNTRYAISNGRHVIKVYHNSKLVYQKQVFVSSQEVRIIEL